MSEARMVIGDVFNVLAALPDGSVKSVITSPPYLGLRAYLPADHPDKALEIGSEPTPADFLTTMLRLTDALWNVLADDGTIWINLGDKASGSGGAGGDWPRAKSVCWVPELFGASLAYGRNLLTGERCRQWVTRPAVTWCKPSPIPGEIHDKFRPATELIVWASKNPHYYFDLDAVRLPAVPENERTTWNQNGPKAEAARRAGKNISGHERYTKRTTNPAGAPPLNWWKVSTSGYGGEHFATFPPELITRPVIVSCPPGGVILDPFGGSGTTGMVATGHGRDALLIDIDERNLDLARERVGMFLTTNTPSEAAEWLTSHSSVQATA